MTDNPRPPSDRMTLEERAREMWMMHPNDAAAQLRGFETCQAFYLAHLRAALDQHDADYMANLKNADRMEAWRVL